MQKQYLSDHESSIGIYNTDLVAQRDHTREMIDRTKLVIAKLYNDLERLKVAEQIFSQLAAENGQDPLSVSRTSAEEIESDIQTIVKDLRAQEEADQIANQQADQPTHHLYGDAEIRDGNQPDNKKFG